MPQAIPAIIAVAAAAAGTGMQMAAASKQRHKMQEVMDAALASNRRYQQTATAAAAKSAAESGPTVAKKQIGEGTKNLEAAYKAITSVPVTQPGQETAKTTSMVPDKGTRAENVQSNQARAALGGYNEWSLQQWIKDLQAQQEIAAASQYAKMNTAQVPYRLWQAQNSAGTLNMAGQATSTLGSLAAAYGMNQPEGLFGGGGRGGGGYATAMSDYGPTTIHPQDLTPVIVHD